MDKASHRQYILCSLDCTYSIMVKLSIPEDDEVCAMTQEPLANYELEFAPNLYMIQDKPTVKKMTLPCLHSFSAMACIYHFSRNHMRCPLCREGVDSVLDVKCLPDHIQPSINNQLNRVRSLDRTEDETENYREAVTILLDNIQENIFMFSRFNTVVLVVYCYDESDLLVPMISFDYELHVNVVNETIEFSLARYLMQSLNASLAMASSLRIVEFAIGVRSASRDFLFIDRSAKINLRESADGIIHCTGRSGSSFTVLCDIQRHCSLLQFKWMSSLFTFTDLLQRNGSFLLTSY